jgi:hypothetical protein
VSTGLLVESSEALDGWAMVRLPASSWQVKRVRASDILRCLAEMSVEKNRLTSDGAMQDGAMQYGSTQDTSLE